MQRRWWWPAPFQGHSKYGTLNKQKVSITIHEYWQLFYCFFSALNACFCLYKSLNLDKNSNSEAHKSYRCMRHTEVIDVNQSHCMQIGNVNIRALRCHILYSLRNGVGGSLAVILYPYGRALGK